MIARNKMKIGAAVGLLLLLLSGCAVRTASAGQEETVYFFYEEACGSCDAQGAFFNQLTEKLQGLELPEEYRVRCVNTFREGDALLERVCEAQGISKAERLLPLLVTPAGFAAGKEEIEREERRLICESYGVVDDRTIWYYQRPECPDCIRIQDFMEETFASHPEYTLIVIDTTQQEPKEAFKALLAELGVPKEEWQVPFLYNGSEYLSGDEAIEEGLCAFLAE